MTSFLSFTPFSVVPGAGTPVTATDFTTITALNTTTARSLTSRFGDRLNVLDFGADPTGVNDSTAAIQNAINAAIPATDPVTTTRIAVKSVYVPAGTYKITGSLTVRSVLGLKFSGDGESTVFNVSAVLTGAVFDLNGLSRCKFEDFSITGSNTNTFNDGIFLYWNSGLAARSTAYVVFSNISVAGKFVNGFRVGLTGASVQESETQWYSCRAIGQWTAGETTWWQSGFTLGSGVYGNNLDHTLYGSEISNVRYGVLNNASNVSVYGGMIQACEEDLNAINVHGYFKADGFRSENSQRLLLLSFASNPKNVTLSNIQWNITGNVAADHRVISYGGTGTLLLQNIEFHTGTGGTGIQPICWLNTTGSANVIIDGVHLGGTGTTLANFIQGSANVNVFVRGAEEMNDTNVIVKQWGETNFSDGIWFGKVNAAAPATAPDVRLFRSAASTLSSSGSLAAIAGVAPGNGTVTGGNLFSGAGAPPNTLGNNGDYYFRTDTPGTTGQRLYLKTAGVWVSMDPGTMNVKDFGAKGDGVTDDTAAIQAAVTAANGGAVFFPSQGGSYKVTSTINVSIAGTTLLSHGAKIFMAYDASTVASGILFNVTASNVTFQGLWIDSTGTASTTTTNKYVIKFVGSSLNHLTNSTVRNCKFTHLPWADNFTLVVATHCVYAAFADKTVVEDCVFDDVGGAAIFTTQLDGLLVSRNIINNTGWYSVQLQALVTGARIESNRITGTRVGGRVWGGSINLMSNGTAIGTEGGGRNSRVDIVGNYISGVHSYTAAVHIESSSYVNFENNTLENVTLSAGSPFYADGTSPVYVRAYSRVVIGTPTLDEGSCDHITIRNNRLLAVGTNAIGIYVDNQHKTGVTTLAVDLQIVENKVVSTDALNTFKTGIAVHGADGGWANVLIAHNEVKGTPTDAVPVSGLIGVLANTGLPVSDVRIIGNSVEYIGTPTTSTHLGIAVGDFTTRAEVLGNSVRNCFQGIRLFANAAAVNVGINIFNGNASSDYLYSSGPTVATAPSVRYGGLFLTGRASNLAATSVAASVPAGEYTISVSARTTTNGTGTTASATITWTDEGGVKSFTTPNFALNAVDVTGQVNVSLFIHAIANSNIQVAVNGTYGTSQYAVSAVVEKLN